MLFAVFLGCFNAIFAKLIVFHCSILLCFGNPIGNPIGNPYNLEQKKVFVKSFFLKVKSQKFKETKRAKKLGLKALSGTFLYLYSSIV